MSDTFESYKSNIDTRSSRWQTRINKHSQNFKIHRSIDESKNYTYQLDSVWMHNTLLIGG